MITQKEVVEYLKGIELGELRDLISVLEDELGVMIPSVVAPPMMMDEEVEQTEFDVVLTGFTGKKVDIIKAVRKMTGAGLKESKKMVEETPTVIASEVSRDRADEVIAALKEASGVVEVR